jgi:hypothetical protein
VFPNDLARRVRREYLENPGLRLTFAHAQRLWSADRWSCAVALRALMDAGFLLRAEDGCYKRRTSTLCTSSNAVMESRDPPWDCRWAEPVLAAPAPLWLDAFSRRWTCLKDGEPRTLDVQACLSCPRWEPRLVTRRRGRRHGPSGVAE